MATDNKQPESSSSLRPYQLRALEHLRREGSVILDHSTGAGKSLSMLKAIEEAQAANPEGRALAITPASLVTNLDKEIKKHNLKIDRNRLTALSYEKAVNSAEALSKNRYSIAVVDEAHRLRNTNTKRHQKLSDIISLADKRMLATGTTTYNKPSDIAPLINIAAGHKVIAEGKEFDNRYIRKIMKQPSFTNRLLGSKAEEVTSLKNTSELGKLMKKHIDHYSIHDDPDAKIHFPKSHEHVIHVEMSPEQKKLYHYVEGSMPTLLRMKVRMNLPLDKKEMAQLNAFSTGVRQVSNSTRPYSTNAEKDPVTPKIHSAVQSLVKHRSQDKNYRGLVYSNYLGAGLKDYSSELTKLHIPHGMYTGELKPAEKDKMRDAYNSGKLPVMLISSSGAEGLDLQGTKHVQILEPHHNKSKIKQVIGRSVRYKSHEHLPEAERHVNVEHYVSTLPKKGLIFKTRPTSIDEYLRLHSQNKDDLGTQMKDLMK